MEPQEKREYREEVLPVFDGKYFYFENFGGAFEFNDFPSLAGDAAGIRADYDAGPPCILSLRL